MKETLNEFIDKIDVMLWESLPYNIRTLKTCMNILWYHNDSKFNIVIPYIMYDCKLTYYTQDLKNSQGNYISILISKKQVLDEFHFSQERKNKRKLITLFPQIQFHCVQPFPTGNLWWYDTFIGNIICWSEPIIWNIIDAK